MGVHILGSRQNTQAWLPIDFTTPHMLENSMAAHLNTTYIPYSIPITLYRAPLQRNFYVIKTQRNGNAPTR